MKISSCQPLIAVILIGLLMVGCKPKSGAEDTNKIQFDSINVDETYHLLDKPENPNCNLQIKFVFPVKYANKEVLEKIRFQFVSSYFGEAYEDLSPEKAVEGYVKSYMEDYKSLEVDFKKELEENINDLPIASWFSYYEVSSNEITYNKHDILSYAILFESYTGGAHGAHSLMNYVVDLKTGEIITEEDIFMEDFQDSLAQILVDKITEQNDVQNPKELENIGFFSVDEIFPNGNFAIDDEGITYYFNEYEIAAYVVGITSVKLPYKEIKHLLRKTSPITNLI